MDKAIDVHDHVIRTQLGRYNGYEVTTEGDAFLLAFHEASDAIAWSIATQQVSLMRCTKRSTVPLRSSQQHQQRQADNLPRNAQQSHTIPMSWRQSH